MDPRHKPSSGLTTPGPRHNGGNTAVPSRPTKRPQSDVPKPTPNDKATDFKITCRDAFYFAHMSVLRDRSPYFRNMFRFGGKEMTSKEVLLDEYESVAVVGVLRFMYSGFYTLPGGSIIPKDTPCTHRGSMSGGPVHFGRVLKQKCLATGKALSPLHLLTHIRIFKLADYLMMEDLKKFVCERVVEVLHVYWQHRDLSLSVALEEAFTDTLDGEMGLRQPLIDILKEHYTLWSDKGSIRSWLKAHPQVFKVVYPDL